MRSMFSVRRLIWCISVLVGICFAASGVMAQTRTLESDTELHPQGWTVGDRVAFKKRTVVELNVQGEVISGTLAEDAFLRPRGWDRVINDYYYVTAYTDNGFHFRRHFPLVQDGRYNMAIPGYGHLMYKAETSVVFSEQGDVLKGTLEENATIRLGEGNYGFLNFAKNHPLAFYPSGAVKSGVLAEDTYLRPRGWTNIPVVGDAAGFIRFKAKKPVLFNEQGELLAGTLKEDTRLLTVDGTVIIVAAGSDVFFGELGVATLETDGKK